MGTPLALRFFLNVFDIVLEDKEIRLPVASQADERLFVVLDRSGHFLSIVHLYPHFSSGFDQLLEILLLLERLFRRARRLSLLCRRCPRIYCLRAAGATRTRGAAPTGSPSASP